MTDVRTAPGAAEITAARLQLFAPRCDYLALAPMLDAAALAHAITTPRSVRHWLAQMHVESAGLTILVEDLNYSAEGLCRTWPAHFPTQAAAAHCAGAPQALAGVVYGDRMGNRSLLDGWTYRGRGLIQLTGRANYAAAGERLAQPFEQQPQLVGEPLGAAATAADFWRAHGCDRILAAQPDDVIAANLVRRIINGGLNGAPDVLVQLRRAAAIWRG